jgi:flagellar motor switch/type III secretory pathway protein FliN
MAAPATLADAGRVRRLRWWSDAALLVAAGNLRRTLDPWAAGWGLSVHEVQACNAALAGAMPAPAEQHELAAGAARLWHGGGHAIGAMAALLFACPPDEASRSALAGELAAGAWQDLLEALASGLSGDVPVAPRDSTDVERAWSGAVRIDVELRGAGPASRFSLRLNEALAAAWCAAPTKVPDARPAPQRAGLAALAEVVAPRPVRVSVHLAPVELDLGTLQSLAVGDVIRLPHRLDDPLHVGVDLGDEPSRTPLCRAHLAQRDGRLAAELVTSTPAR